MGKMMELIKQQQTPKSERNRQQRAEEEDRKTARCEKFIDPATPDQFPFITK